MSEERKEASFAKERGSVDTTDGSQRLRSVGTAGGGGDYEEG